MVIMLYACSESLSSPHRKRQTREKKKTRATSCQLLHSLIQRERNLQQVLHSESCLPPSGKTHYHSIFRSIQYNGRPKFTTQLTTNLIITPISPIYFFPCMSSETLQPLGLPPPTMESNPVSSKTCSSSLKPTRIS